MKKLTNQTVRRSVATATLALAIPLAACGGTSTADVVSARPAAAQAPMSAVDEVTLIEALTAGFESQRPVTALMSALEEVQLIEGVAADHNERQPTQAPASWTGATHEYR